MKSILVGVVGLFAIVFLLLPVVAWAEGTGTSLQLTLPAQAKVGDKVRITATLKDSEGRPIQNARIYFSSPTSFLNYKGEMEIDDALTDAKGIASVEFAARQEKTNTVNARFKGSTAYKAGEASGTIVVGASSPAYVARAGVELPSVDISPAVPNQVLLSAGLPSKLEFPIAGVWMLVLVLTVIWSLYMITMILVLRIASEPERRGSM
ncbi:MAG: Ig-like domain-containing protein [Chloroflexi bacterium]|nr:Ig-like domain-containing protein [Chloroflexota bacterium]